MKRLGGKRIELRSRCVCFNLLVLTAWVGGVTKVYPDLSLWVQVDALHAYTKMWWAVEGCCCNDERVDDVWNCTCVFPTVCTAQQTRIDCWIKVSRFESKSVWRNRVHESDHRHEVGSLTIDPPYECDMRFCSNTFTHHYSSGLYSTRLETRTKESSKYASRTVLNRLVRRSERNHCDLVARQAQQWGLNRHS